MGWDIGDMGFKIVLSPDVPKVVNEHLRGNVESFLCDNGLTLDDISSYIFHSGGPKVLEAMENTLNLPPNALEPSWRSLREVGNLSAASVLAVLEDVLVNSPGKPGTYSILAAMGPAFCSELVLLKW
jgi:alkylresorcinol/alkylpyrone synthase